MQFKGSDIISVSQFDAKDLTHIMATADAMRPYADRQRITRVLEGAVMTNLFFEPSTRSRISFGAAFNRLGGSSRDTTGFDFSSVVKGESMHDTARVVSGYSDIIVVRHPKAGTVQQLADATNLPVINGGDGIGEHPTQGLLDLYTLQRELPQIDGMTIAMVGDLKFGRTVHSLAKLLALNRNITFNLVAPRGIQMPEEIVEYLCSANRGHQVVQTEDLLAGISGADVVYSTRIQEERFPTREEFERYRGKYKIDKAMMEGHCKQRVLLLHPLPRDSREGSDELSHDLNGLRNLGVFRQTDNGIPIRMALFALLLGVEDKVHKNSRPVEWYVPEAIDPNPEAGRPLKEGE